MKKKIAVIFMTVLFLIIFALNVFAYVYVDNPNQKAPTGWDKDECYITVYYNVSLYTIVSSDPLIYGTDENGLFEEPNSKSGDLLATTGCTFIRYWGTTNVESGVIDGAPLNEKWFDVDDYWTANKDTYPIIYSNYDIKDKNGNNVYNGYKYKSMIDNGYTQNPNITNIDPICTNVYMFRWNSQLRVLYAQNEMVYNPLTNELELTGGKYQLYNHDTGAHLETKTLASGVTNSKLGAANANQATVYSSVDILDKNTGEVFFSGSHYSNDDFHIKFSDGTTGNVGTNKWDRITYEIQERTYMAMIEKNEPLNLNTVEMFVVLNGTIDREKIPIGKMKEYAYHFTQYDTTTNVAEVLMLYSIDNPQPASSFSAEFAIDVQGDGKGNPTKLNIKQDNVTTARYIKYRIAYVLRAGETDYYDKKIEIVERGYYVCKGEENVNYEYISSIASEAELPIINSVDIHYNSSIEFKTNAFVPSEIPEKGMITWQDTDDLNPVYTWKVQTTQKYASYDESYTKVETDYQIKDEIERNKVRGTLGSIVDSLFQLFSPFSDKQKIPVNYQIPIYKMEEFKKYLAGTKSLNDPNDMTEWEMRFKEYVENVNGEVGYWDSITPITNEEAYGVQLNVNRPSTVEGARPDLNQKWEDYVNLENQDFLGGVNNGAQGLASFIKDTLAFMPEEMFVVVIGLLTIGISMIVVARLLGR